MDINFPDWILGVIIAYAVVLYKIVSADRVPVQGWAKMIDKKLACLLGVFSDRLLVR
jgi:hypothetical protein